jgi:queuine tRNA-ribosyltransferase
MKFQIHHTSSQNSSRSGQITLPSGKIIETPAFMPVGTQATVKGVLPEDLQETGVQMILCNTYHLMMRPGDELIRQLGGLHFFMNWPGGIITDSGGFQVYSLAKRRTLDSDGVTFQHHIDGTKVRLTPESALEVQRNLGSDIAMVLDECIALPAKRDQVALAVERTLSWAARSQTVWAQWQEQETSTLPQVFAICQGGTDLDLRIQCAEALSEMDFPGYALGGFAVGEERDFSYAIVDKTAPHLPPEKPRYLMGIGTPSDLVRYVGMGIDLFDCVLPTRNGRNGQVFTPSGKMSLSHARFRQDENPIDSTCPCPACKNYSRAYLRHLYLAKEILSSVLHTLHNLTYYQRLMSQIRQAIQKDCYATFAQEFFELHASEEPA